MTNTDNNWYEEYFKEIDPIKRQELKEKYITGSGSEDEFINRLWVARHGKRRPKKDEFLRLVMDMKYLCESGSMDIGGKKKKLALDIVNGLFLFAVEKRTEEEQDIIYRELKNVFFRFIDVSANGRGFTSVLFGMGQMSDDSVCKKIADQISTIVIDTPQQLHMDREFEVLKNAALDAFREVYPNREHFLRKR